MGVAKIIFVRVYFCSQIQDSSLVVSVLQTCLERGVGVGECLQFYPLVNITTTDGENTTEHSNKYFIMYGEDTQSRSVGELRYSTYNFSNTHI